MQANDCGIIILAAGSSSRLGTPKQLLMYQNKTLLQRAVDEAIAADIGDVVIVTGFNHDAIASSGGNSNVRLIYNERWQQGMASSMQAGLSALLAIQSKLSSVLIMLCDQPFVSSVLLKEMVAEKNRSGKEIIACEYKETIGVPALFSRAYFNVLLSLVGTEGAKKLIAMNGTDVGTVSFPLGAVDIDTSEDYANLIE